MLKSEGDISYGEGRRKILYKDEARAARTVALSL